MALTDGYFVDADHLGIRISGSTELLPHVLLFEFLDSSPVKVKLFGDVLDRRRLAPFADIKGKALGIKGAVREKRKLFLLHLAAPPALDAPNFQFQVDAGVAAGEVSDQTSLVVIE